MRFHHLDLNLLVALDVLLEEQNITRAAERLHMTQSATSGVLGRLRTFFEDELLVQVGRKMQPTPYALELAVPVREVLLTIRSSITSKPVFDPASSKRHFRLVTSDYLISVLFAQVIQKIHQEAPHITFEMLSPGDNTAEMLMRGELDLMIAPERYVIDGHPAQLLFEEDHVCVVWRDNPEVGDVLTLEQYMQMGHISVGFGRNRHLSIEDWFMSQYGFNRRLEVITNDFNTLPQLLVGTQRVATMHRRLAELYARYLPLRILPPPVKIPVMREFMLWHRSMEGDPMHRWLRERIRDFIQSVDQPPDALRASA
ncbi:LysR family transcriptional regulator [Pseudomonas sp. BGr12]|uniref:LysR family transcriptional regulator n=1 Tax=unclassified Pseudomonas TaxID=196821 RepID=UPI00178671DF|nr:MULTISPECIES: LysR family transcriptional regulator [unclassified Pseudomonas]MBD9504949.1 LysR family transcriptional regulator [Pseudomonas sp. PDM17]MBD9577831.1 LysR family transcriptional regulator [Pseudomonas sp. PDM23]MBD9672389.1 LysR family transcriptional regulator [Pseudomonas sp. PDM21]MDL2430562.1 LysR family transcriptional regulator [Pseudomonas sp. BJa5]